MIDQRTWSKSLCSVFPRLLALLACFLVSSACAQQLPPPQVVDVEPRPLAQIAPATVIGDAAPEGWSRIVFKNIPRIEPEEAAKLNSMAPRLASMLSCSLLARAESVAPAGAPPAFRLTALAAGLSLQMDGRDVIITSDTQARIGAKLGAIQRTVLSKHEEELSTYRVTARGSNIAVVDVPTMLRVANQHQKSVLRYAVMVDPQNGAITTALWVLRRGTTSLHQRADIPPRAMITDNVHRYRQIIDPSQLVLGIPNADTFAMETLPESPSFSVPAALEPLLSVSQFTPATLMELERGLRAAIPAAASNPMQAQLPPGSTSPMARPPVTQSPGTPARQLPVIRGQQPSPPDPAKQAPAKRSAAAPPPVTSPPAAQPPRR